MLRAEVLQLHIDDALTSEIELDPVKCFLQFLLLLFQIGELLPELLHFIGSREGDV